jgi:hypothetical protein
VLEFDLETIQPQGAFIKDRCLAMRRELFKSIQGKHNVVRSIADGMRHNRDKLPALGDQVYDFVRRMHYVGVGGIPHPRLNIC